MIFGSGGVVALILGCWGGLWAAKYSGAEPTRRWVPVAASFVLLACAAASLTSQSTLLIGMIEWARPNHDAQQVAYNVTTTWYRPYIATLLAGLLVGTGRFVGLPGAKVEPGETSLPPLILTALSTLTALASLLVSAFLAWKFGDLAGGAKPSLATAGVLPAALLGMAITMVSGGSAGIVVALWLWGRRSQG